MSLDFVGEVLSGFDRNCETLEPHIAAEAIYASAKKQKLTVEEEIMLEKNVAPLTVHAIDRTTGGRDIALCCSNGTTVWCRSPSAWTVGLPRCN